MVAALSALDIAALLAEICPGLAGARCEKVYQVGLARFKLSLSGGRQLLLQPGAFFCLTAYDLPAPTRPSQAAMLLRKHLEGRRLAGVCQRDLDRIVIFDFSERKLVLELFAAGNLVLTDAGGAILWAWRPRAWAGRTIRRGTAYAYPPPAPDPRTITFEQFAQSLTGPDVVRALVRTLGLGGRYAEELCARAGVPPTATRPDLNQIKALFAALGSMLAQPVQPVLQAGELYPFPMRSLGPPERTFTSMAAAVDELYTTGPPLPPSARLAKLRRRLAAQEAALAALQTGAEAARRAGDLIYEHYGAAEAALAAARAKKKAVAVLEV